jgi:hypothetical protein
MVFGGFPKKIRYKTFYFHAKKIIRFILFLLCFGPRVHFRGQKLTFWSNHPKNNFQSKTVKLSYFTLEKSFFSFILKLPTVARSHQQTMKTRSLIRNMVFGGFPKKIRNKTFYFHTKKNNSLYYFFT